MPLEYSSAFNYTGYFLRCSAFLDEHRWIFEHSNTKFVQAGVLDVLLDRTWIQDFKSTTNEELNQIPLGYVNEEWSASFKQFLHMAGSLLVKYEQKNCSSGKGGAFKGVSPKKLYEIENLTAVIGEVCVGSEVLLDFGSGLGYLSQNLHLKHDFKVLGLEGDSYRVSAAQQRQLKLFPESHEHVKYIQHFIEENSFEQIRNIMATEFSEPHPVSYAIVGLHACADLSITAIKMFLSNDSITSLVIMPCCYHKLVPQDESCTNFMNIPISSQLKEVLKDVGNFLGRPFLRLGCQQTSARWNIMTSDQHVAHGQAMFERSLVESIVGTGQLVTVNKHTSRDGSRNLLDRYQLCDHSDSKCCKPWTDAHRMKLDELSSKYPNGGQLSEYLTCLQTCLQSICENLILLDRMCYIETETALKGINVRSNLVKLVNDNLSPRCFVIVAEKSKNR
ncbi:methyltransferase-like protein 25B [Ochlerotatus camptorhynchus]|uniref:methyltransferase-like protein 25B n=1 Tax=Ochlerotatus camptorhynchus TaxID=644619 RepID=UPI0031DC7ABF